VARYPVTVLLLAVTIGRAAVQTGQDRTDLGSVRMHQGHLTHPPRGDIT